MAHEQGEWERTIAANPEHSQWYIRRFRDLAARGDDIVGEARLVDAMVGRGARVLDAGCGPGRVGGHLHAVGHDVVGVDVDPALIAAAEADHPGPTWLTGNLADLPDVLAAAGRAEPFDIVVCAGNVVTFLAPSTRLDVLRGFEAALALDGRVVVGFGAGRGYGFDEFLDDARTVGLVVDQLLSSWDVRPFTDTSGFLVAILRRP